MIGDPALRISYPEYKAQVTAVNGKAISDEPFTFKALEKITVEGEILDTKEGLANDFTGILNATVLDSKASLTTLGNNTNEKEIRSASLTQITRIRSISGKIRYGKENLVLHLWYRKISLIRISREN